MCQAAGVSPSSASPNVTYNVGRMPAAITKQLSEHVTTRTQQSVRLNVSLAAVDGLRQLHLLKFRSSVGV